MRESELGLQPGLGWGAWIDAWPMFLVAGLLGLEILANTSGAWP